MTPGQKTMANSIPVVLASDQSALSATFTPSTASGVTTEALVSVATTSTSVLASNASRKGGWVRNISDVDIYVSFSATATTAKPSALSPGSSLSLGDSRCVYTGAVAAIHADTGSKSLEVVEF